MTFGVSMRSILRVSAIALVAVLPPAIDAAAQTPPAAGTQPTPPPTPPPPAWHGGFNTSVNFSKGTAETRGISVAGGIDRRGKVWGTTIEGDHAYTSVTVAGTTSPIADQQSLRGLINRDLSKRTYLLIRPAFRRNVIQAVDHVFEQLVGYGIRLAADPKFSVDVVPIAGLTEQEKNVDAVDGTNFTYGAYQSAKAVVNKTWNVTQNLVYLQNSKDSDDYRLQFRAQAAGKLHGPLSLNLGYSVDRENIVLAGSSQVTRTLTLGVAINF